MAEASFLKAVRDASKKLSRSHARDALVVHHDEADGLTSAAIIVTTLESQGISASTICLDKLFPEVLERILEHANRVTVFTDIGSGHVARICEANKNDSPVFILDHHDTESSPSSNVHNVNPELYGIPGEEKASAATVAYLFAKASDPKLRGLAPLALIGSAEIPGPLAGLNKIPLQDAVEDRSVETARTDTEESIRILSLGKPSSHKHVSSILSILGSVGFYRNGPKLGLTACLEGFNQEVLQTSKALEEERKRANRQLLDRLRSEGLTQAKNIQWFHAHDNFRGMGPKVIGSFCSYLRFQRPVSPMKYLVGVMDMQSEIPEYGRLSGEYAKVSSRAPELLAGYIRKKERPALSKILPEACMRVGGFGDGHTVASSGVVPAGKETELVEILDALATNIVR